jgi:hypothetical protein
MVANRDTVNSKYGKFIVGNVDVMAYNPYRKVRDEVIATNRLFTKTTLFNL